MIMKKICLIVVLFLFAANASAKWKNENSVSWWRGSSSWSFVNSERTDFHKGKDVFSNNYYSSHSGPSFGFVGGSENVVQRDYTRRRSYYEEDVWSGINVREKTIVRSSHNFSDRHYAAQSAPMVARSNRTLLNKEVWSENRRGGKIFSGGGSEAVNYGRRVKPQNAPGSNASTNGGVTAIGGGLRDVAANNGDGAADRIASDMDGDVNPGGQYGFGEVPRDDAPVGDGILILLFFAALTGICKIYHQDFD